MKLVEGDLVKLALDGEFDVIVHGCNCQCVMGAGLAKTIKAEFPEAFAADKKTVKGDRGKLGTFSCATVERGIHTISIVNGYTQFHWRGSGVKADVDAIQGVMKSVKEQYGGQRIGLPKIGAGLAGGDWDEILKVISSELEGEDFTIVEFAG